MNKEQVLAWAREADLVYWKPNSTFSDGVWWMDAGELGDELEHFAALIASRVSAAAKAEEREALENADWTTLMRQSGLVTWGDAQELGDRVVDAIRARGETK